MPQILTDFTAYCPPCESRLTEEDLLAVGISLENAMGVGLVRLGRVRGIRSVTQLPGIIHLEVTRIVVNGMMTIDVGINIITNISCK